MNTPEGMDGRPPDRADSEVFYFAVPPRKHSGEAAMLLIALALLFVLLVLLVGHPKPAAPFESLTPPHASAAQSAR
jgi:hypothetical protein